MDQTETLGTIATEDTGRKQTNKTHTYNPEN